MSLNTAHTPQNVLLVHQGETILLHSKGVTLSFSGNGQLKHGEKTGSAYLTSHRLIFLNESKGSDNFRSFSFPFCCLSEIDVEQPVFGANYLKGKVRAQSGESAGWKGEAKFKMTFKCGGAIDFARGMVAAFNLARQMNNMATFAEWNVAPPSYEAAAGNFNPAPPGYYQLPTQYYGWTAPNYQFPAPAPGSVFISDAPPPYPGIGTNNHPPSAPPAYSMNGITNGNGYGFVGFTEPAPPPSYDAANKKIN